MSSQYNCALMSNGPIPHFVDPRKLADRGTVIDGDLPLSGFGRLAALLAAAEGLVRVRLHFERDAQGVVLMSVAFAAQVPMQCQRCLEAVTVPVRGELVYAVMAPGAPQDALADGHDALEVGEAPLDLWALLEDELLLALPIVPTHPAGQCQPPVDADTPGAEVEKESAKVSPFSVLARLKQDPNP